MTGRTVVELVAAGVLGVGALIVTGAAGAPVKTPSAATVPVVARAVEGLSVWSLAGLFAVGVVMGAAARAPVWAVALAAVCVLPALAVVDMVRDPTSHNLWPLEFGIYGFLGGVVLVGAVVGRGVRMAVRQGKGKRRGEEPR